MSQRHPGARRARQDHQNDPDDLFIAKVLEVGNWAKSNQQFLTILGVVAVIGIAGAVYYANYRNALVQQAAESIEAIHQSISLQDTEGAKAELALYLQRFAGTPYEGEARLLLGDLYLHSGDAQQAQAVLEPIATSPSEPIEFQAAALLAAAYEQDSRWDEAESTYLRIADRSELDFQIRSALQNAARIRADRGNAAGAVELYERVLEGLDETSPDRGLYEMRIQELRTAANI